MTKQVRFEAKTQFSLWLRNQPLIDSRLGFVTSDIDYVWMNYKTGQWMILEEKRMFGSGLFPNMSKYNMAQYEILKTIHNALRKARIPEYKGMFLLVFEHTSPDDGRIWVNNLNNEISAWGLIEFLSFRGFLHNKGATA